MMRTLPCLMLLTVVALAQVSLTSGPFSYAGGNQHKHVVTDAAGNLYALSVAQDASGNRPLQLQVSPDGGTTWLPITVGINDATSGLSGTNPTNGCCLAIGGTGILFLAGLAGGASMILPGISGAYLLLLLGQYITILQRLRFSDSLAIQQGFMFGIIVRKNHPTITCFC